MPKRIAGHVAFQQEVHTALHGEQRSAVDRRPAQHLLDPQQLVVLGHAIGPRGRAGLDLAVPQGDGQVGDGRVLGLAAAMADDGGEAVAAGQIDGLDGLGERADLVELDEDAVGDSLVDAPLQPLGVGHEQVVADQLDLVAQAVR